VSVLTKYLGLGTEANDAAGQAVERVETVTEFLGDVAEKLPDLIEKSGDIADHLPDLFNDALDSAAPWLSAAADALGEALPPVKAILSITKFLTREPDPHALGLLAVSVAYQAALADAAKELARITTIYEPAKPERLSRAALGEPETPEAFEGFRLASALSHPLVRRADKALNTVAEAAGYPEYFRRALLEGIHVRFAEKFRATISDGRVKEKFDPLFRLMQLDGRQVTTYAVLRRHLDYQLWRFTRAPALGKGGGLSLRTPLAAILTPLDCGTLHWGEIRRASQSGSSQARRRSPFDEDFGGRRSLLDAVVSLIRDPDFDDAIVVQGTAGAGKSAFTLQLCQVLREMALFPIRVRMRDLSLDPRISLMEDVAHALTLNCGDEDFDAEMGRSPPASDPDMSHILDEAIWFEGITMSPYVLIFDGWDEISISASEDFRFRIEKTLDAIRRQVLSGHGHRVRVVLTGRPSDEVNAAKFLLDQTPVLTVRPFTSAQLVSFVYRLLHSDWVTPEGVLPPATSARIWKLIAQFDKDATEERRGQNILRLPLLALLAVWVVLNDENPPEDLTIVRSSLYRRLVDLTTRYGGNIEPIGPSWPKITGDELRDLLQRTAAAITLRGTEHIPYDELTLRLEASDLTNPETVVGRAVIENQIAKLMLSFFFNIGQQGCEFIHKSFREYLFAEGIVAALKRNAELPGMNRPRDPRWREFSESDPRQALADELGLMLAPHWLGSEEWRHLAWLIEWEIRRMVATGGLRQSVEESLPLGLEDWQVIRDRLANLWDWWAEGVHTRPQPYRERGTNALKFNLPFALRLAEQIIPTDLPRRSLPEPVSLTALDAHLGDALFRLNCTLHFQINKATGWLDRPSLSGPDFAKAIWEGAECDLDHPYQTRIRQGERTWWVFAPSSPDGINHYLDRYFARINAADSYPEIRFPFGVDFSGVDFHSAPLSYLPFAGVSFRHARLAGAEINWSILKGCSFTSVFAPRSLWVDSAIHGLAADPFEGADLSGASFQNCLLEDIFPQDAAIPPRFSQAIATWSMGEVRRVRVDRQNEDKGEHSDETFGRDGGVTEAHFDLPV
jgi:uncharacterized protein YjbI with pentapeptide repeats